MKRTLSLCLALAMLLSFAACGTTDADTATTTAGTTAPAGTTAAGTTAAQTEATPSAPKEITHGVGYDATTMDVHNMNDDGSYAVMFLLGEGLTRNDDGFVSPGAAESWDVSADSLTYVFHLRSGLMWNDGTALNAHDFVYSFFRLLDPDLGLQQAQSAFIFKNGEAFYNKEVGADAVGIKATDDLTLELVMERPSLELLFNLSDYPYFPVSKATVEAQGVAYGTEAGSFLTNGAFTLTEWAHEDRHVLVKNENYWNKDAIKLDTIIRRVGVTADTAVDMMLTEELDVYAFTDITKIGSLVDSGYASLDFISSYQWAFVNSGGSTAAHEPFMANTNFRKALNYAVNREGIVASIFQGAQPANRLTAPSVAGVNKSFHEEYPYEGWPAAGDAALANQCLELALQELGATINDVPELSLLCYESERSMLLMQAVQDMLLGTLGIKSKIDPQPIQQMLEKANNSDFDLFWGGKGVGTMDWLSPGSFAGDYDHTNLDNVNNYKNETYTELYHKARVALTLQERKDLLFEMEKVLCEDPGGILVGWVQGWLIVDPAISGVLFTTSLRNINLTYADLAQ